MYKSTGIMLAHPGENVKAVSKSRNIFIKLGHESSLIL
jgi:hypothetical protein